MREKIYRLLVSNNSRAEIPHTKRGKGRREYSNRISAKNNKKVITVRGTWWR